MTQFELDYRAKDEARIAYNAAIAALRAAPPEGKEAAREALILATRAFDAAIRAVKP